MPGPLFSKQLEFSSELNIGYKDRYYDVEDAYEVASLYSLLGERDRAMVWLQKAYADRSVLFEWVKTDPAFDNMRSDPRFVAIVRIANLK